MKDALGHGSDGRGGDVSGIDRARAQLRAMIGPASHVSTGNVSPQAAASAMHSGHIIGGAHDSTYHTINTSAPRRSAQDVARAKLRAMISYPVKSKGN